MTLFAPLRAWIRAIVHRSSLVGVSTGDPMTMAGATLVILIVGSGAGFIPARRASRIDPAAALRQE